MPKLLLQLLVALVLASCASAQQPRARSQPPERPALRDLLGLGRNQRVIVDSSDYVVLDSILITGNRQTRTVAVLREMNVQMGDTLRLSEVPAILSRNQQLIYNTGLFNKVEAQYELSGHHLYLHYAVVERWYIWPELVFEIQERTLWEWLEDPNTFRTSYGAGISYRNVTGRNDRLNLRYMTGYTERYSFGYQLPFAWPAKMIGFSVNGSYNETKEVVVADSTGRVRRIRVEGERGALRTTAGQFVLSKRITQNNGMNLQFGYTHHQVPDSVLLVEPRYLSRPFRRNDHYPTVALELWWDSRDVRFFPLSGHSINLRTEVSGLGVGTTDFATFSARGFHYGRTPFNRFYWAAGGQFVYQMGRNIPYPAKADLSRAPVRGFDTYFVDGTLFWTGRAELRYELFRRQIVTIKWLPRAFRDFMTGIYPYVFQDVGYNNDFSYHQIPNPFRNRMLSSFGFGVDIPYIYDNLLRLEFARTNFGETQFLLNISVALQ